MITNKKRMVSLFIALVLILSFSSQILAASEKLALPQEFVDESTVNGFFSDLLIVPTDESLKVDEDKLVPPLEPDLKPDPKPDEVTLGASEHLKEINLGASGQETPAAGPTITPFATQDFIIVGVKGAGKLMIDPITSQSTMFFVNESSISFTYSNLAYGVPYRYNTAPNWDNIVANFFTIDIVSVPEGILEYSLEAALAEDVNGSSGKPQDKWSYANAQVNILIQRVESFTKVSGATNPTDIKLGRIEDGNDGEPTKPPTFFWEITKVGDSNPVLSGKDCQPDMDLVNKLLTGDYTVTTTAKEFIPMEYENIGTNGDSVTHTTPVSFKVTVGDVTVKHIDVDTRETIHPDEIITGTFKGDSYATEPADIRGYELVKVPTNKDGFFSANDQTVTYEYKKAMTQVRVEHVYRDGTPVRDPVITTGPFGTTVSTVQLTSPEIEILDVEVDASSLGNTDDYLATYPPSGVITVTYVYEYKGSLVLISAPSLQFGTHVMAGTTMTYPLTQGAVLSVKDNRTTHGNWRVSAKASQLTEVNGTRTLDPNALGFMDKGLFVSLKDVSVVWESSTIPTNPIQNKSWQEGNAGAGFVATVSPFQASAAAYSAVITWSLENT